jgi:hypothetical protein
MARLTALIRNPEAWIPGKEEGRASEKRGRTRFRAQFLGIADDCAPLVVGMADLQASEALAAMREANSMAWPPQAIGFRLLDVDRQVAGRRPIRSPARIPEPC